MGWGWLSPPDQFLDHLTVIKRLTSQPEALSDEGYHRTTACWHFFISVLNRVVQLKNHPVFDTDDENVIDLPWQTLRFLSIDASLATLLPPKINKVWFFVAQKVDKSFTPEQRKSENIFNKYLKRYLPIRFPTILRTYPQPIFNLQLPVPNAHLRAGKDILMEVLNKDSWKISFIHFFLSSQHFGGQYLVKLQGWSSFGAFCISSLVLYVPGWKKVEVEVEKKVYFLE